MSEPGGLHRYRSLNESSRIVDISQKTMSLSHIAHLFVEISLFPKQYFSWQVLDKSIFISGRLFWATTQSYENEKIVHSPNWTFFASFRLFCLLGIYLGKQLMQNALTNKLSDDWP